MQTLRFASRGLSESEHQLLEASEAGFAFEVALPARETIQEIRRAWLFLEGDSTPARGEAGSALCMASFGVCASMEGVDLRRIPLNDAFLGSDLSLLWSRAGSSIWSVPSGWGVSRAVLQVEVLGGCSA